MLRGTTSGLEFVFDGDDFEADLGLIEQRLAERPEFYRGSQATASFEAAPSAEALGRFLGRLASYGIALRGVYGDQNLAAPAEFQGLSYLGAPPRASVAKFERKRAARVEHALELTDKARSLQADFAGARADIATRRARGETSVPKPIFGQVKAPSRVAGRSAAAAGEPSTLYHRGTLRGGQSLQQLGSIVIVGDVNPGAELVATGDILVWGALRGTAHAGAQGDTNARVLALELKPTQLRIATHIAVDDGRPRSGTPEIAFVEGARIAIAPYAKGGAP